MIKKWKRGLVSQVRFCYIFMVLNFIFQEISLIDEKPPDYNLDSEDEAFRQTLVPSISEIELEKVLEKLEETEKSRGPLPPFCKEWNWGKGVIDEGTHNEAIHKYWVKVSFLHFIFETKIIYLETYKIRKTDKISFTERKTDRLYRNQ